MTQKPKVFTMSFAKVYACLVAKAERKGRTQVEVDSIIHWLTGYDPKSLQGLVTKGTDYETFFTEAPRLNPARSLIKGSICGIRVEDIEDPTMREIRYLDKLIDELAKGKSLTTIMRKAE
ncbi:MAG: DUF2200 domain-containing protein [Prosthecobacter sp.]|uniref:DUF2200 domain-containing protein n=1 Tax=Prosthecobacter sp. TaxID=1965333 RepID=UPI003BAFA141